VDAFRIVVGALVAVATLAIMAAQARAQEPPMHVHEEGKLSIRLMRGPCVHPMILSFFGQAGPQYMDRLRAIESTWPHRDGSTGEYAGCWLELSADEGGRGAVRARLLGRHALRGAQARVPARPGHGDVG